MDRWEAVSFRKRRWVKAGRENSQLAIRRVVGHGESIPS